MNTTQNTQRIIATAVLAVTAGLALSSCAGQRSLQEQERNNISDARIAEQRAGHLELAEARAQMYRDLAKQRAATYSDQAERRAGLGGPSGFTYQDQAERRQRAVGH